MLYFQGIEKKKQVTHFISGCGWKFIAKIAFSKRICRNVNATEVIDYENVLLILT